MEMIFVRIAVQRQKNLSLLSDMYMSESLSFPSPTVLFRYSNSLFALCQDYLCSLLFTHFIGTFS
jgi:hypothetical protein